MNIEQDKFERIVGDVVSLLNAKHRNVQTGTGGGKAVAFQLGLATTADALFRALALNGITVSSETAVESAVAFFKLNQDRLGVAVEVGEDAIYLTRAATSVGPAQQ